MKIRESGCIAASGTPSIDLSSGGIFNLIQQFSPSSLPVAGMGGNVILIKDLKEDLILVPSKAIKRKGRDSYVIKSLDNVEEEVVVKLGETDGSRTSILSGLNEGDVVIIKSEIIDKDKLIDNFKDNESTKNQNPPPPNQPKSSGFRNNAGE